MNPRLSSRFAACVLALLAACAILPGVGSRVSAAEVNATFTSAATVPVTAANYTATGNAVEFALNFTPPVGTNLTVVKNTGLGLIDGAFDNLAQGQKVSLTYGGISYPFVANYYGGTGNDLVLQWANRRLLAWGANTSGQLGNNTLTNSSVPVAVDMSGVLAGKALMNVAAGGLHCLALCADGTVVAWGANSDGQLGNRSTTDSWVPVAVNQAGAAAGKIIIAVAAGENHSLALGADGTVAAWGNNTNGQLGNGGTTTSTEPVPVDQTGVLAGKTVVALAAGYNYSLVLCADGTLAAWGWNFNGALGNGATADSSVPVLVNRTGVLAGKTVTSISAGGSGNAVGSFSLAVCSDGTVAGWGVNGSGQLGNGSTTPSNVPVAVTQSGVLSGKTVVAAAAEDYSGVVLCSNGTIAAWGSNYSGGLGNSTNTNSLVPVLVTQTGVLSGKTVATIAAGHGHAFALCTDATLAAWGFNSYGQVGNNTFTSSNVPVLVNTSALRTGERFSAIRGGNNHSLAVTASPPPPVATTLAASGISDTGATLNGTVAANGNTTTLSFEYGLTTSYGTSVNATPASLTGTAASAISATPTGLLPGSTYHYRVVALITNGVTKGADMTFTTTSVASLAGLTLDPGTLVPGFDPQVSSYEVTLPNPAGNLRVSPVAADPGASVTVNGVAVAAGAAVTLALAEGMNSVAVVVTAANGIITHTYTIKVMRWPATYVFQAATDVPVTVGGCIATGSTATLALGFAPATGTALTVVKNTGTAHIQGAYDNLAQGQVVQLAYNNATYKFVVNYFGGSGNDLVLQWAYTKLYAWGSNGGAVPLAVGPAGVLAGKTVTAVALGAYHTLALCADGTLAAWGSNGSGQLGNGSTSVSNVPVAVNTTGVLAGKRVIAIAAGADHSLVLCADGTLAAWGANSYGVLGSGSAGNSSVPVAVSTAGVLAGKTVLALSTGPAHSLALCADGTLAAWGYNGAGQLGNGTTANSNVPVAVTRTGVLAGKTITAIAAGASSMALCSDGTIASWGSGWSGNLGNGTTVNSSVPVAVVTTGVLAGKTVTAIATGYNSNLALCADRTVVAWGYNGVGGLGNGTNTDSSVPVVVTGTGVLSGKTPIAIAASYAIYALCADGTFAAWGDNQRSQFGNGTSNSSNVPVAASLTSLGSGEKFIALAPGPDAKHTMAVAAVPLSNNADLAALELGSAVLDPVFAPGVTAYTARVNHGTPALTVEPTVADGTAKVTVNGIAVVSGAVGEAIAATPGSTITVRVTAENGTMKSYGITVREDAALASLGLSQGSLLPAFSPFARSYSVSVGAATAALLVTPVAADSTAAVTVNGTPASVNGVTVPLVPGANTVTVAVTALDGTLVTYQMIVTRAAAVSFTYSSATAVPLTVSSYVATDNTVNLALSYAPATGTELTVINNTGNDPIVGRFANLAQGQTIGLVYNHVTYRWVANYFGGTGNDLVLQWANTKAYGWGANAGGQVGNGSVFRSASLVPVTDSGVLLGKSIASLAAGGSHSLALCGDGTVAAWGENASGQLGNGSTTDTSQPVDITGSGVLAGRKVIAVAAGEEHSLAICEDGMVAAWGQNSSGQLGNGQVYPSGTPVAVVGGGVLAGKTVAAICAGSFHSLALCTDGTVAIWGKNSSGQLGDGGTTGHLVPVAVVFSGPMAGKRVTAISAGEEHSLVRFADGSLAAWGSGYYNRLGNGSTTSSYVPIAVPQTGVLAGKNVTRIAAGGGHNLVLCADGVLVAWGDNRSGQLGIAASSTVPALVSMTGVLAGKQVTDIAAGSQHSLALCSDGTLTTWGAEIGGSPGPAGSSSNQSTPVLVPTGALGVGQKFTALARGSADHALVLAATPVPNISTLAGLTVGGGGLNAAFSPGTTAYGVWVPTGTTAVTITPTASDPNATITVNDTPVASGTSSAAIPLSSGNPTITLRVTSQSGQATTAYVLTVRDDSALASLSLSAGTLVPAFSPVVRAYTAYVPTATTAVSVTAAAAGPGAVVTVNGTASGPVSLVQGSNSIAVQVTAPDGNSTTYTLAVIRQTPLNFTFSSSSAVPVTSTSYTAAGNSVSLALNFAPAVGTTLRVINNTGNDFITGTFDNLAQGQPVNLTYNGITYPFVANYYGGTGNDLVLQWANVRVLGWGYNNSSQLGLGANSGNVLLPTPVVATGVLAGKTVIALAASDKHSLALCSDGALAAWGSNGYGQLGDNNNLDTGVTPVAVLRTGALAGKTVIAIAAGGTLSLALCSDGTVAYWGRTQLNLENGTQLIYDAWFPTVVPPTGVLVGKTPTGIAVGNGCLFVRCSDGTLAGWGRNESAFLGNNSYVPAPTAVAVDRSGVLAGKVVTAFAARDHGLALTADGILAAWGSNGSGQLGNNSATISPVPVRVTQSGVLAGKTPVAIAAGLTSSFVSCADGTLATWGSNFSGQLGNGTTTSSSVPVLVTRTGVLSGKTVTAISAGGSHCLATCGDGSLAAWGSNSAGQLGNNGTTNSSTPVLVSTSTLASGERFVAACGGNTHSLAITALPPVPTAQSLAASALLDAGATLNGSVNAQGTTTTVIFEYGLTTAYGSTVSAIPATVSGSAATAVRATVGGLLSGTTYHFRAVAANAGGTVKGEDLTFTTTATADLASLSLDGAALYPAFDRLRLNYVATVPFATDSIAVTPGCADANATVKVNGVAVASGAASGPISLNVGSNPISTVITAAGGANARTYAITVTRLPQTFTFNSAAAVPVTASDFAAAGMVPAFVLNHTPVAGAALTVVKNTGAYPIRGAFDNLAQGQTVMLTYAGVTYSYVANYFGGTGNDLVLQWANMRLLAWGSNSNGELGNKSTTGSNVPVPVDMTGVLAGKVVVAVATGENHSLALCADGTLAGWGYNPDGRLGNGTSNTSLVPVAVTRTGLLAGKTVIAISAGTSHSLALCSDGTLAAWGSNWRGTLGNNSTDTSTVPVAVDQTGVLAGKTIVSICAGNAHNLVLCADGTLATWGWCNFGQFGNNTTTDSSVPVLVDQTGVLAGKTVVAVSGGNGHSLALCSDGTVAAWGYNDYGQLGNNSQANAAGPILVDRTGVLAGKTVVGIRAGASFSLALCSDGTMASWGSNDYGRLGNNSTSASKVPVLVTQTGVLAGKTVMANAVGITGTHSLALCSDGTLAAWGYNYNGQLGNNSTTNSSVPVLVNGAALAAGERFAALGAGSSTSVALVASPPPPVATTLAATAVLDAGATLNGSVNANGGTATVSFEYGLTESYGLTIAAIPGTAGSTDTAVSATLSGLIPGTTYHFRVIATSGNGTVKGADVAFTTSTLATLADLTVSDGVLSPAFASTTTAYFATVPTTTTSVTLTSVVTTAGATVEVAGSPVASGTASAPLDLTIGNNPFAIKVTSAAGSITMTYSVTVTRSPAVFSFDAAADVPLTVGNLVATGNAVEFAVTFAPQPGTRLMVVNNTGRNPIEGVFSNLAQGQAVNLIFEGVTYAFVANYFGGTGNDLVLEWARMRLVGWGFNTSGQLGNNSLSNSRFAVPTDMSGVLAGKTVTAVTAGSSHTLALCSDGTLAAWGDNGNGELGNASNANSNVPVRVDRTGVLAGKAVIAVTAGGNHCLALCADGTLAAWGRNGSGQLGNGTTMTSNVPVLVDRSGVLAGKVVVTVAARSRHCLALCADGTLAAWGENPYGELGDGSTTNRSVPVLVNQTGVLAGKTVTALAAGFSHTLALCADGSMAGWGHNNYGQLGDNSTTNRSVPVLVNQTGALSGKTITALAAGASHTVALCADGSLAAWGYNNYSQLGDATTTSRSVPVAVTQSGVLAGKAVRALAAGSAHNLVLGADGTIATWGYNVYGQLGDGTATTRSVPVVAGANALGTGERSVSATTGSDHTLIMVALPPPPLATTLAAVGIADTAATLDGRANAQGTATAVAFEYGLTTAYGSAVAATPATVTGTTTTAVSATLSGLIPGRTYHFRVIATSPAGTVRGGDQTFTTTTLASLAGLTTSTGTLMPAFDDAVSAYSLTVPTHVTNLTVTPTVAHPEATIRVNGTPVASGTASGTLDLAEGGNRIDIEVFGAGGGNTHSYTVAVVRLPVTCTFTSATDLPLTVDGFAAVGIVPPFTLAYAPTVGTNLTVVRNTGMAPVSSTFANLAQGQAVRLEFGGITYPFVVNYFGGSGNDLVLQWANTRLVGWGYNGDGQFGNGTLVNSAVPVTVLPGDVLAGKTITATAAGNSHSLALCSDGTVAAWGLNGSGQLGTNATGSSTTVPVAVDHSGVLAGRCVVMIAAGFNHSLALCADGTLAAWGLNTDGQLGNGGTANAVTPVLVDRSGALAEKTIVAIAIHGNFNLVLCHDGSVVSWGDNSNRQLGDGTTIDRPLPVVVNSGALAGKKVVAIACDANHSLGLCADGALVAWGSNTYGQLGNGTTTESSLPVLVDQSGVLADKEITAITCGSTFNLVLCADGTLSTWGYNSTGQLGDGSSTNRSVPVLVNQTGVLAGKSVMAIKGAIGSHSLALCSDGTLAAWGYNRYGVLGDGSTTNRSVPVLVAAGEIRSGERVVGGAAGEYFNLALVASPPPPLAVTGAETLVATGKTDTEATLNGSVNGQGNSATVAFEYGLTPAYGTTVPASPATVSGTTAKAASATLSGLLSGTTYHFRVVATSPYGVIKGDDLTFTTTAAAGLSNLTMSAGTLSPAFLGSNINYLATVPETTGSVTVTPVVARATATVKVNGVPVPTGTPSGPITMVVGDNSIRIDVDAGDGVNTATYTVKVVRLPEVFTFDTSTDVPLTVSDLAAGGQPIAIALNHVPVPGTNLRLVTNTGPNPIRGYFSGIAEGQRVRLAYGGITYSFVATYRGGTGNDVVLSWSNIRLVTWGSNANGNGSVTSNVPVPANMNGVLAGKLITDLATGGAHGVLRCQDGMLATWGDNDYGQSGTGGSGSGSVPAAVDQTGVLAGKTVIAVTTGGSHDLALCSDGTLAAWGNNTSGTLGSGSSTTRSNVPVRVDQSGVLVGKTPVAIGAGGNHSVALCADGTLAAWGAAQRLGNGGTSISRVPVRVDQTGVLAGKTPVALAVGGQHSLVLCADGTLAAWGLATSGQLGNGSLTGGGVPVLVDRSGALAGRTVIAIAAGGSHNLALCADGTVAAWGENGNGQLGNFSTTDSTVPTLVNSLGPLNGRKVVAIAAGGVHSLALCADGTLLAWGDNQYLTLGTGNNLSSTVPTPVAAGTLREGERIVAIAAGYYFSAALVAALPETLVSPLAATDISDSGATLNGSVNPQSGTASVTFEYGLTSAYGHTVTATPAAAGGNAATPVSTMIGGLLAGSTYHYRVVATNGITTARSEELTFTTTAYGVLAELRLSGGTLVPAFDPNVGDCLAMAPFSVDAIRVTPVAAMGTPAITVNGVALASGAASDPIPLAPGENTIRVSVTAADGIQGKTYTLTLTRLPGEFAFHSLTDIPLTVGALGVTGAAPPFSLHQPPEPGTVLTVINNTGLWPITGTFANLAQGQLVPLTYGTTTWFFAADYGGGTGNDLVLHWAGNRVVAWGSNAAGQLGNGTTIESAVPAPVDASGVLADTTVVGLAGGATLSAIYCYSLALCADGRVAAWGYNDHGQLGNGSTTASNLPVWVDASGVLAGKTVVAVSAGNGHSLALCLDGTIAAWGNNSYSGQLGNGDTTDSKVPVAVTTAGALAGKQVAAIAAGASHSLALCSDGTLVSWGSGAALGNNSTASYAPAPVTVDQSGVLAGKRVVAITAGQYYSLVLCDDGTLAAWGNNANGVLGNGSTTDAPVPVLVDRSGVLADKTVVAIAGGSSHALALCSDGTLAAWGTNGQGQLGNNSTTASAVPVLVDQTGVLAGKTVTHIAARAAGSLALASDGTMAAWGYNNNGQLGDGSNTDRHVPTAVDPRPLLSGGRLVMGVGGPSAASHTLGVVASPLPTATPLAATGITGTAATLNGSVNAREAAATVAFEVGLDETYGTTVAASPNAVTGKTDTGVAGFISDLKPGATYHYRVVATSYGGIVRSADRTFTTLSDNALLAALGHDGGGIAPGFEKQRFDYLSSVPFETAAVTVNAVTDHPRATLTGNGAAGNVPIPVAVGNNSIGIVVTAEDGITTKTYHIAVNRLPQEFVFNAASDIPLTSDGFAAGGNPVRVVLGFAPAPGTVLTMVNNTGLGFIYGRFGNLAQGQRVSLTYSGTSYDFIANYHGGTGNDLVLQWANTELLAWGGNGFGQLGDDTTTERRLLPTPVNAAGVLADKVVLAVAGGYLHSLALCADGTLAAWGYNAFGQLGTNGPANSPIPVAVDQTGALAGKAVVAITAGPFHNLALCEDGTLVAWGYNNHGQLGDGTKVTRRAPVAVARVGALATLQVVAVAAGAYQSFALGADGTVVAWGYNDEGELGDGTTTGSLIPVAVDRSGALAGKRVASLASGQYHSLALCTDGTLVTWGYNKTGQLGNHRTTAASSPVAIGGQGALAGRTPVGIRAGGYHSLAWCADGTLAAWGSNNHGQLGVAGPTQSDVPLAVDVTGFASGAGIGGLAAGGNHSLLRLTTGRLAAWGENGNGQLGDGSTLARALPTEVAALTGRIMAVASGAAAQHTLALQAKPLAPEGTRKVAAAGLIGADLICYAFQLDPSRLGVTQLPEGRLVAGEFVIRFTQPVAVNDVVYGAEWSETMQPGSWQEVLDTGSGNDHRFAIPATGTLRGFIRLKVSEAAR